jgi:hypothetical protein
MNTSPKVLFINGVKKNDLIRSRHVHVKPEEVRNKIVYANIPSRVILRKDLGKEVTCRCWQCDIEFTGAEIFFPKVIEENKFLAEGTFNSFKCLLSYILLHYGSSSDEVESINKANYLRRELEKLNPQKKYTFEPAISKYIMEKYGGELPENEYISLVE